MENETVDGIDNGSGPSIHINDGDVWRGNSSREGRRPCRRLARPVKVRSTEVLRGGNVTVTKRTSGELLSHSLNRSIQSLLVESHVRPVPGYEQNGRVSAVSSETTGRSPVGGAADAVPRLIRHAMDAGNLVEGGQLLLIETLQVTETENIEVELVREVSLKITDLAAERNTAASAGSGGNSNDCNVSAHGDFLRWFPSCVFGSGS
jgi:hypothetical protein